MGNNCGTPLDAVMLEGFRVEDLNGALMRIGDRTKLNLVVLVMSV